MIPLESAREYVLGQCERLHPRAIPLGEALGCATSVPLRAPEDVPPFDNTAVDGYAVHAADTHGAPVTLRVVGLLPAGAPPPTASLQRGEAIRIMTGAVIPPGADAVVMVEDTEVLDGARDGAHVVRIGRSVQAGDAVRLAGDDVHEGEPVFPPQTVLGPAHLGVLASMGYVKVPVYPRARVGVLSTGDELIEGGADLQPGQIRESNRVMLLGLVERLGAIPVDLGLARDDEAAITAAIERGVDSCDALISSGGVSMGDFDLIKVVLDKMGTMRWMQIAMRPAKPFAFGTVRGKPVFGLPGNPVSSLVSFEMLARPGLLQMMGYPQIDRPVVRALADDGLSRRQDGRLFIVRVHATFGDDGRVHVRSSGAQGSHQLAATAAANALAMVPDGDGIPAGGEVDVRFLG